MLEFIIALLLIGIALTAVVLKKIYFLVPIKELKRRARHNDQTAKTLYRAVAYDDLLLVLLWSIIALCFAGSFVMLAQIAPTVFGFVIEVVVIAFAFAWLPTTRTSKNSTQLTLALTPGVVWLLEKTKPVLDRMHAVIQRYRPTVHTGLYEREDIESLLATQKAQPDSRIAPEEIDMLLNVLAFGDKAVGTCMIKRHDVYSIKADEQITPVLIRDLHGTGHTRFPVYDEKPENIVGTVYLNDLISLKRTSGTFRDVMESSVYYVHEEYPLEQALHAFLTTKHHLFIVLNRFEEYVGIITIEDLIEQLLGCRIVDDFDQYDNRQAVANDHVRVGHKQQEVAEEIYVDKEPAAEKVPVAPEETQSTSDVKTEVIQ